MKFLRYLWCRVIDCDYSWAADLPEPQCKRCGAATYWPVRRSVGRLLGDLRRKHARWKRSRDFGDDIPF